MDLSRISIGVPGAVGADTIRSLAPRIESAGFRGLWLNDTADGDSLAGLAAAAEVTTTLELATGVIALDRRPVFEIARSLRGVPEGRLTLGIGSGGRRDALRRVSEAVAALREATAAPIVVGALGPRMRRLAAERADGVLLNWLTPAAAAAAMADLRHDAGDRDARGVLYVRTIVHPAALPALVAEADRYAAIPSYAANLTRIGARAIDTTIDGTDAVRLAERAGEYTAVLDELVLRAVPAEASLDSYLAFVDAIAAIR